eukprot:CAMPEP_0197691938 /NCGR_PEP_ID=MMETSP1338-20131121/110426_1 /TAXON_ID=43686 ORGANISM="Pelagodinium beii, Strain RCC1491" /NCGR_SAMPLE_ID=MMETSP1338 /ASSEMBLY_ACC=CAM_ASM_000754 /LENGTH=439 /DNA_ID=CAMNT_0043274547 /DNA_START=204 /DNA_END=1521 /DNA_ORIENTATION=+
MGRTECFQRQAQSVSGRSLLKHMSCSQGSHTEVLSASFLSASPNSGDHIKQACINIMRGMQRKPKAPETELDGTQPEPDSMKTTEPESDTTASSQPTESESEPEPPASMQCVICLDSFQNESDGITCCGDADTHFLCGTCFPKYVHANSEDDLQVIRSRHAQIMCPVPGCAKPWVDVEVARHVSQEVFTLHLQSATRMREQAINDELQGIFEQKLQAELHRHKETQWLENARQNVIEHVLTLACPRCGQAFLDFDGCFALTCPRCACGFCATCLKDCGSDAHSHVRTCPSGRGDVWGTWEHFEVSQHHRRSKMLVEFLQDLPENRRSQVLLSLEGELRDLNLSQFFQGPGVAAELPKALRQTHAVRRERGMREESLSDLYMISQKQAWSTCLLSLLVRLVCSSDSNLGAELLRGSSSDAAGNALELQPVQQCAVIQRTC